MANIDDLETQKDTETQNNTEAAGDTAALKAAPRRKPRQKNRGVTPAELARQRARRNSAPEKSTVTAVSAVRKDLPQDTAQKKPAQKRPKAAENPVTAPKTSKPEPPQNDSIMNGILAALEENDAEMTRESEAARAEKAAKVKAEKAERQIRKAGAVKAAAPQKTAGQGRNTEAGKAQPSPRDKKAAAAERTAPVKAEPGIKKAVREMDPPADDTDEIASIKRKMSIANAAACSVLIAGIGLALLFAPRNSGFIRSENRLLAEKPEMTPQNLADGSFFADYTKWYTDTIAVREKLRPVSGGFSKLFGITPDDTRITGDAAPVRKETLASSAVTSAPSVTLNTDFRTTTAASTAPAAGTTSSAAKKKKTTEKVKEVAAEADGEWMGNVIVSGKGSNVRAMSAFYGTFDMGTKYAEAVNAYKSALDSRINVFTLNMPSASAYYMPANLADQFTSQHDCIRNIGNTLSGVINVDVYDALEAHTSEYIYSRTDHHWQPLGAYYAAKVFSEAAQFDFPDLNTYQEFRIENFVGTMYAYSDYDEELKLNPDTFIYYKPDNNDQLNVTYYNTSFGSPNYGGSLFFDYAEGINCYSAILGQDEEITEIDTGVHNGRTLVIIKDSYGNALVPFLTHGFEKIYVCDFRYMEINAVDFVEKVGATDLLFAVSLQAAHTESNITIINNDRIQEGTAAAVTTALPETSAEAAAPGTEDPVSYEDAPSPEDGYYGNDFGGLTDYADNTDYAGSYGDQDQYGGW